ncbi:hypothetical protein LCGC14_1442280, partial [marine sediment metagenome]
VEPESTDPPDPEKPKYFLTLNERQRYETEEDAIKGFGEAGKRIEQYSRHGTPEEVETQLQRLGEYERLAKPDEKKTPDPLDGLNPEQRGQWEEFNKRFPGVAEQQGFVRREQVEGLVNQMLAERSQIENTRTEFRSLAKERGIELTPESLGAMEEWVTVMANKDTELSRSWNAGDVKAFSQRAFMLLHGASPVPQSNGTADQVERPRDSKGKFTQAADYQDVKDRTVKLPKSPPKGSGAPLKGGDDLSLEDQINPVKRLGRTKAWLEERGFNG